MKSASARQRRVKKSALVIKSVCGAHSNKESASWLTPQYSIPTRSPSSYYIDAKAAFNIIKDETTSYWRLVVNDTDQFSLPYLRVLHDPGLTDSEPKTRNAIFYYLETPFHVHSWIRLNIIRFAEIQPYNGFTESGPRQIVPADWIEAILGAYVDTGDGSITISHLVLDAIIRQSTTEDGRWLPPEITSMSQNLDYELCNEKIKWPGLSIPGMLISFLHYFCSNVQPLIADYDEIDNVAVPKIERRGKHYTLDQGYAIANQCLAIPFYKCSGAAKQSILLNHSGLSKWDPLSSVNRLSYMPQQYDNNLEVLITSQQSRFRCADIVTIPTRSGIKITGWIVCDEYEFNWDIRRYLTESDDHVRFIHFDGLEPNIMHYNEYGSVGCPVMIDIRHLKQIQYTLGGRLHPSPAMMTFAVHVLDIIRSITKPLLHSEMLRKFGVPADDDQYQPKLYWNQFQVLQAVGFRNEDETSLYTRISPLFEPVLRAWYPLNHLINTLLYNTNLSDDEKWFWRDFITLYLLIIYHRGLPTDLYDELNNLYHTNDPGKKRLEDETIWAVTLRWLSLKRFGSGGSYFTSSIAEKVFNAMVNGVGSTSPPGTYLLSRKCYLFKSALDPCNIHERKRSIYDRLKLLMPSITKYTALDC